MKGVIVTTVAWGGWYPAGAARMVEAFRDIDPGRTVQAWVNILPPGAPTSVVVDGYDYTGYCAKPFALLAARESGADIGLLLDAAFWPIQKIDALAEHIERTGYYLCENGYRMGEWCKDEALEPLGLTRDEAMEIPEVSSYAVGLNFHHAACNKALEEWCRLATDGVTFPGPHTQMGRISGRNAGHVSHDERVLGHRHDQTALSAVTWRLGMRDLTPRPIFTAYDGYEDHRTVLVNRGM